MSKKRNHWSVLSRVCIIIVFLPALYGPLKNYLLNVGGPTSDFFKHKAISYISAFFCEGMPDTVQWDVIDQPLDPLQSSSSTSCLFFYIITRNRPTKCVAGVHQQYHNPPFKNLWIDWTRRSSLLVCVYVHGWAPSPRCVSHLACYPQSVLNYTAHLLRLNTSQLSQGF